jgi:SAM-dependent methyltransferase
MKSGGFGRGHSLFGGSGEWDRIWRRASHRFVSRQRERAAAKIEAAIKTGLEFADRERILDVGCGSGHALIEAATRLSSQSRFVACDSSPAAAHLARENFRDQGLAIEVLCADAASLPLREESFKKVLLLMTLQHVYDDDAVLREIDRVLAQHGELFIAVPSERSIISMSYKLRRFVTSVPVERRSFSVGRLVALVGLRFQIDACRVSQVGPDRWLSRAIDGAIAHLISDWGRYITLRCSKSATR